MKPLICKAYLITLAALSIQLLPTNVSAQKIQDDARLFDGVSLAGWEGDTINTWRIEEGAIVAGSLEQAAPRNEFLCTTKRYSDFELNLKFKTTGTKKINAGVQFRSERVPKHHEVIGYQADIGGNHNGCLYDEYRRRKFLARPGEGTSEKATAAIATDGWQTYRIRAAGDRIQLWLNGIQTVDYIETDKSLPKDGVIALQIHGQMQGTIAYKDIVFKDISEATAKTEISESSIQDMAWISGHWTGEAMGGEFEETWNPPMAGEMMGMFKMTRDGKVVFYELLTIAPQGDSFVLRLKHFGQKLVGWEEKEKSVEFPLQSVSKTEVKFNGLKFSRIDPDQSNNMKIEIAVEQDGKQKTLTFDCKRAGQ